MEYAKQEILDLGYDERKTKKGTSFIKKHKTISIIIAVTTILIGINSFMIHEFIKILGTL